MIAGFTGTRYGMNAWQREQLKKYFQQMGITELHQGMCIGGDEEANTIARDLGLRTVGHPPIQNKLRSECIVDQLHKPLPYMTRNHNIVDAVKILFVGPYTNLEVLRSGTWATYRYAVQCGIHTVILKR